MDVQTLAAVGAPVLPPDPSADTTGGIPATAGAATQAGSSLPVDSGGMQLPHAVAKLFSGGSTSAVTISFQVAHFPNEIVTVFKNSQTGEVISQVPSEIMVKMAEFFDQVAGVLLDKTA